MQRAVIGTIQPVGERLSEQLVFPKGLEELREPRGPAPGHPGDDDRVLCIAGNEVEEEPPAGLLQGFFHYALHRMGLLRCSRRGELSILVPDLFELSDDSVPRKLVAPPL